VGCWYYIGLMLVSPHLGAVLINVFAGFFLLGLGSQIIGA
jgi:hypothetical protein